MSLIGMDLEAVTATAKKLQSQKSRLHQLASNMEIDVNRLTRIWVGPDATNFRNTEWPKHKKGLLQAETEIGNLASTLIKNAEDQRKTSDTLDGAGVSGDSTDHHYAAGGDGDWGDGDSSSERGSAVERTSDLSNYRADFQNLKLAMAAQDGNPTVDGFHLKEGPIHGPDGFDAMVYEDAAGNIRVVYLGTDPNDVTGDWSSNITGTQDVTSQDRKAVELALRYKQNLPSGANIEFVGHSRGGRLATLAAIATDSHATTFNTAGISKSALMYAYTRGEGDFILETAGSVTDWAFRKTFGLADAAFGAAFNSQFEGQITNYNTNNDPLTKLQDFSGFPDGLGTRVTVQDPQTSSATKLLDAHLLPAVERGMREYGKTVH